MARHEIGHFDLVSEWFPRLTNEHTFDTKFIPLTKEQGEAIVKTREMGRMIGSAYLMADDKEDKKKILDQDPIDMIGISQKQALKDIEIKLDTIIKEFNSSVFVRLDTRSPKDAVLNSQLVKDVLLEELQLRPHKDTTSLECATDDAIAYWRATSKAGQVKSGKEAVELLTRSNRIQQDLKLGFLSHPDISEMLVVRKWEEIHPELEFRVFIVNNQITAITQYHKGLYVKLVADNIDVIKQLIFDKFEAVKDLIVAPEQSYTIDFALLKNANDENHPFSDCIVVEINDPPPTAGTSLFEWDDEGDRNILQHGPFTIRVQEKELSWEEMQQKSSFHPPLVQLIDEYRGRKEPKDEPGAGIVQNTRNYISSWWNKFWSGN